MGNILSTPLLPGVLPGKNAARNKRRKEIAKSKKREKEKRENKEFADSIKPPGTYPTSISDDEAEIEADNFESQIQTADGVEGSRNDGDVDVDGEKSDNNHQQQRNTNSTNDKILIKSDSNIAEKLDAVKKRIRELEKGG